MILLDGYRISVPTPLILLNNWPNDHQPKSPPVWASFARSWKDTVAIRPAAILCNFDESAEESFGEIVTKCVFNPTFVTRFAHSFSKFPTKICCQLLLVEVEMLAFNVRLEASLCIGPAAEL